MPYAYALSAGSWRCPCCCERSELRKGERKAQGRADCQGNGDRVETWDTRSQRRRIEVWRPGEGRSSGVVKPKRPLVAWGKEEKGHREGKWREPVPGEREAEIRRVGPGHVAAPRKATFIGPRYPKEVVDPGYQG